MTKFIEIFSGWIRDSVGTYQSAFYFAGIAMVFSGVVMGIFVRWVRPARIVDDDYEQDSKITHNNICDEDSSLGIDNPALTADVGSNETSGNDQCYVISVRL